MLLFAIIIIIVYHCLLVHTHAICHEKHTANIKVELVFPLVSVQVRHGEPGNMHPYNFEPISPAKTYILGIIIVRNPKTTDSMTVQQDYSICWTIMEQTKDNAL